MTLCNQEKNWPKTEKHHSTASSMDAASTAKTMELPNIALKMEYPQKKT